MDNQVIIKISPSIFDRILSCPKSALAPSSTETSVQAEEGVKLHKIAETLLLEDRSLAISAFNDFFNFTSEDATSFLNLLESSDVLDLNPRILEHLPKSSYKTKLKSVMEYITYVRNCFGRRYLEFHIQNIADNFPKAVEKANSLGYTIKSSGYIDALVLKDDVAEIIDLKTGRYRIFGNSMQLLIYAISINTLYKVKRVKTTIHQGIIGNVSSVEYSSEELLEYQEKIDDILSNNLGELNKGISGKHCVFCTLKENCDQYLKIKHILSRL